MFKSIRPPPRDDDLSSSCCVFKPPEGIRKKDGITRGRSRVILILITSFASRSQNTMADSINHSLDHESRVGNIYASVIISLTAVTVVVLGRVKQKTLLRLAFDNHNLNIS